MAASFLTEAFAAARRNEETWNDANLWLVRGDLYIEPGAGGQAGPETCYRKALKTARTQGALSLVLRATVRLAEVQAEQGRHAAARELLAAAVALFPAEIDTPELGSARVVVKALV